ncbi:MAG: polysaccharide pyruvyl transferase family protein [Desulfurococcaceae archaeon]
MRTIDMQRVGLLTCVGRNYGHNFGTVLQAYALQRVIVSENLYCEIIDFVPLQNFFKNSLHTLRNRGIIYAVYKSLPWIAETIKRKIINKEKIICQQSNTRRWKFEKFKQCYLQFSHQTFRDINKLGRLDYDIYVVGSDLVWSPKYNYPEILHIYLLSFVKNRLKLSYAASIGESIPRWARPIFRTNLKDFNFISVREETSAKVLKECVGIDAEVVLDPTLLLTKEDWYKLAKIPEKEPKKPYMLVYDIYRSKEIMREINHIAKERGCNIITYSLSKNIPSFYHYCPQEFLWLYKNTEYVVTTSFHGTVFAILFNKPFYTINPGNNAPPCRIIDLLKKLNLKDRFINDPKSLRSLSFDELDWNLVNNNLENERKHSLNFLKRALRGVKNETSD